MSFYYFFMAFGKRELFKINQIGIEVEKGKTFYWENIFAIELKRFPPQGLEFLYYLVGSKGVYFYQIIIYEDYLLKKRSKVKFTSFINTDWDTINQVIGYHTTKNNIELY